MSATLYAGPGKVYRAADTTAVGGVTAALSAAGFQAEGENGSVDISYSEETSEVAAAMFGRVGEQLQDQTAEITFKPFDNWGALAQLFPRWIGASTGALAGSLQVGGRPHGRGASKVQTKVWTTDGRLYTAVRTAVTGHPTLHLGAGKALYGDAKILCIGDETLKPADGSFLFSGDAITESAGADPGGPMTMADFIRGSWTAVWGTVPGFGGDGDTDPFETEDEFTVETQVKYSPLKVQGLTRAVKLDSAVFMVKCKPYGPTHSQLLDAIAQHTHGALLGGSDLVLTGPSSKTITLKAAEIKPAGFKFGGTTLGTGEVGFVNKMTFTTGAPQPLIVFSA